MRRVCVERTHGDVEERTGSAIRGSYVTFYTSCLRFLQKYNRRDTTTGKDKVGAKKRQERPVSREWKRDNGASRRE
jgi:hypothetical protein